MNKIRNFEIIDLKYLQLFFFNLILISSILSFSSVVGAIETSMGEDLFLKNCSGCHVNGGNIVRRGKTLKMAALKRNYIDSPEAIAEIAKKGIGSMHGYEKNFKDGDEKILANWIWQQAQKAWTQG